MFQMNVSSLNSFFPKTLFSAVTLAGVVAITGCSQPTDDVATTDVTDNNAEVIRIATEGAYPPFNYTANDGSLGGFDVDVANALCEHMQAECKVIAQDWDGIIPGLKANKYDAIVAGMSITPERQQAVDFTEPYFTNTMVWLAKNDGSFDETNISNYSLGGQRATTLGTYLQDKYENKDGNSVNLYDTYENAYLDLKSGRLDAILAEKVAAAAWLPKNPEYAMIGSEIDNNDNIAIAVRQGDALKDQFNDAIAAIRADGTLAKIEQANFGTTNAITTHTVADNNGPAAVNIVETNDESADKVLVIEGEGEHINGAEVVEAEENKEAL